MLSVIIVIVIIILSVILAGIGAYVVIHSADEKEEVKPVIDVSGKYAVVVRPARESLTAVKPSDNSIRAWLETQEQLTPEQRKEYLDNWKAAIEETIKTIDEGDQNGTVTYRIELGPKGKQYVKFVPEENFITREQIRNHAEILPPYGKWRREMIIPSSFTLSSYFLPNSRPKLPPSPSRALVLAKAMATTNNRSRFFSCVWMRK